jgi:hypothetical protein
MVRAELGNSNRDHAVALIQRVHERYVFPRFWVTHAHWTLDNTPSPSSIVSLVYCSMTPCHLGHQHPHPKKRSYRQDPIARENALFLDYTNTLDARVLTLWYFSLY